jgi:hypothetical protein
MARLTPFRRRQQPSAAAEGDGAGEQATDAAPPSADAGPPSADAGPPPPRERRPAYHPGILRRERRALVRAREERIRDLGGLILEMFRRDRFREDLVREQSQEIFGMEARIQEIDVFLATARHEVPAARCACGAPIVWGSHFCANCGRPTGEAVATCPNCGHALPADAKFCGNCGTAAPAAPPAEGAETPSYTQGEQPEAPAETGPTGRDPWER